MARPKLHRNTTELDAEIARVQRETGAELRRLQDERQEAEGREDRRRGEVVRACLAGSHGDALRRVLAASVSEKDRPLFGVAGAPDVPVGARAASSNRIALVGAASRSARETSPDAAEGSGPNPGERAG